MVQIACFLFTIPAALITGYYLMLAIYALARKKNPPETYQNPSSNIAIVIPAHNEERTIVKTLLSCKKLDYPNDIYKVYVIADNCSDRTAEIVKENNVVCYERSDNQNRGKGYALQWAIDKILPEGYDAILILDADCELDPRALKVFDGYLRCGAVVMQAKYVATNQDESPISYATAVGNLIENELFYSPKSKLGLAVFLQGTGMMFAAKILERYPWRAFSVVEDVEYTFELLRNDIDVKFVEEVKVMSEFPAGADQLSVQRERWAGGNLEFGRSHAIKLMWEGFLSKRIKLIDAGWTLLVLSRPLVLLNLSIVVALGCLSMIVSPGSISLILLTTGICLSLIMSIYFLIGILLLGLTAKRFKLLLFTPIVIVRLTIIAVLGALGGGKKEWARTPRA